MSAHPDVIEFVTLYEEVQRLSNGKPDRIPFLFKNNQKFADICRRLADLSFTLESGVRDAGDTVLENVDPNFISKWRHYQKELDPYIGKLTAAELLKSLGLPYEKSGPLSEADAEEWLIGEAKEETNAISLRLEVGSWKRRHEGLDEEDAQQLWEGERALDRLIKSLDLDFCKMIYREKKLSVAHIPTHSSEDSAEPVALTNVLREAHRAYRLGLPLATIALCRTTSEIVIRDHYRIGDSSTKFRNRFKLAETDPTAKVKGAGGELTNLVDFGSDILHGRSIAERYLQYLNVEALPTDIDIIERVAFLWLEKLTKLIAGIPKRSTR
jgi:hypothetical protein